MMKHLSLKQDKPDLRRLYFFIIPFSLVFFNVAWVAEDAFITFRAVDNLLNGYGPVWNAGERVQVYTHPLWYILLSIGIGIFKQGYWVAIGLSYICFVSLWFILVRFIKDVGVSYRSLLVLLVLLLSRAFMDFSSSGLENPLVHLLLAIYVVIYVSNLEWEKKFLFSCFVYGLVYLTRPDAIFIITPLVISALWSGVRNRKSWILKAVVAFSPVVMWEVFSIIYYGSFVPNTALAKVNIEYPRALLFGQALRYLEYNLSNDPITLGAIVIAFVFSVLNKNAVSKLLMLGVLVQVAYICYVGGDYMLGRFLSPSLLVSMLACILMKLNGERIEAALLSALGALVFFSFIFFGNNIKYSADYTNRVINEYGFADERGFYHQNLGVIPVLVKHEGDYLNHSWLIGGKNKEGSRNIIVSCNVGMGAWAGGEKPYWIDPLALTEPFLARLPAKLPSRPGHYERAFPDGYFETVTEGGNRIKDPILGSLYNDVRLAVTGDLWSKSRWEAIYRLNTGYYNNLSSRFDRNATGLMELGMPVVDRGMFSCMGSFARQVELAIPPARYR